MQKLRLLFISVLSVLSTCGFAAAPDIPVLPKDPSVSSGRLPDGIGYMIVSDKSLKGFADVVILQRACQNIEKVEFRDVPVYRGSAVVDSLMLRVFAIIGQSIEDDSEKYGTNNQHIIIAGDVNAKEMAEKMKLFCLTVPQSRVDASRPEYRWNGPYPPEWERIVNPDSSVTIVYERRKRRLPDDVMGTVVPLVSMRMDCIMRVVLTKSLGSSFERQGIPFSGLEYTPKRSWATYGDESCRLSVTVRAEDADRAEATIRTILGGLAEKGLPSNTFTTARSEAMASIFQAAVKPMSNRAHTDRCIASILYGTSMYTSMEAYNYYISKSVPDSVQLRSFKTYSEELFGGVASAVKSGSSSVGTSAGASAVGAQKAGAARLYTVNLSDTLTFTEPSKKKAKVKKQIEDPVGGGTMWTFENGMRVIYKRMQTNGSFYYSMVLGCGASDIVNAPSGESAFYSDMFACAPVGTVSGYDFRRMYEACGISMDCDVGLYDMALYGKAESSDLKLLMQILLSVMNERHPDRALSLYEMECSRLGLKFDDSVKAELYDKMHPTYLYTPCRVAGGLSETLPDNAEKLFSKAFSRVDDGVLLLVGDWYEGDVLKILRRFVDAFRTSGTLHRANQVGFKTIAGTSRFTGVGPRGVAVELCAQVPYTADNYFAVQVLQEALSDMLSGYPAIVSASLNPRPTEHLEMSIYARSDVSPEDLLDALQSLSKGPKSVYAGLSGWRTAVKNRNAFERNQADYWISALRTRFTDAKDIATKSQEKIAAVPEEKLRELSAALLAGGRVIYQNE